MTKNYTYLVFFKDYFITFVFFSSFNSSLSSRSNHDSSLFHPSVYKDVFCKVGSLPTPTQLVTFTRHHLLVMTSRYDEEVSLSIVKIAESLSSGSRERWMWIHPLALAVVHHYCHQLAIHCLLPLVPPLSSSVPVPSCYPEPFSSQPSSSVEKL